MLVIKNLEEEGATDTKIAEIWFKSPLPAETTTSAPKFLPLGKFGIVK